jgi:non-heme chloroperoxidase
MLNLQGAVWRAERRPDSIVDRSVPKNDRQATAESESLTDPEQYGLCDMSFISTKDGTQIFYKDWGSGQPIVFHHGWPLSADDWDAQMMYFVERGYRVIAHDRRGHGRSTQTAHATAKDGSRRPC